MSDHIEVTAQDSTAGKEHARKQMAGHKLTRAGTAGTLMGETDPATNKAHCRARVRVYIGQRRPGGTWHQCGKHPRPGKKTCRWHQALED